MKSKTKSAQGPFERFRELTANILRASRQDILEEDKILRSEKKRKQGEKRK